LGGRSPTHPLQVRESTDPDGQPQAPALHTGTITTSVAHDPSRQMNPAAPVHAVASDPASPLGLGTQVVPRHTSAAQQNAGA
jgi:hypothetical protein